MAEKYTMNTMINFDIKKSYAALMPILLYLILFIYIYTVYYNFFVLIVIIAFLCLMLSVILIDRDMRISFDDNRIIITKKRLFILPQAQQVILLEDIKRIKQIEYKFFGYRGLQLASLNCHIIVLNNKKQIRIPCERNLEFDKYLYGLDKKLKEQSEEYRIFSQNDKKNDKNYEKLMEFLFYGIIIFYIIFLLMIPYLPKLQGWE